MNIYQAKEKLNQLRDKSKYETMLYTASIITQLLDEHNIKPVIVGGLSVEIYTQQEYATRDIDFVSDGYHIIQDILFSLGFQKEGKNFYHSDIEIAVEVPDNYLAGSYEKVVRVEINDEHYVYLISIEDIILDRLRAGVHWKSEEDQIWAFRLLSSNYQSLDLEYLRNSTETREELDLLNEWVELLHRDFFEDIH
jgi:predicted nucleotidyltransferase